MNSYKLLMGAAAFCVSGVAVLAVAGPAQAREVTVRAVSEDIPQATVNVADLQLASSADQKVMRRRVGSAVARVCEPHNEGGVSRGYTGCLQTAWAGARPQMARAISAAQLAQAGGTSVAVAAISVSAGSAR